MMRLLKHLLRDRRGVGAVEFALCAPIVITLIVGSLNIGTYIFAQNSVAAAVDKVGREAAIYPRPSDTQMQSIFAKAILKEEPGAAVKLNITHGKAANGTAYVDLSSTYNLEVDLIFVSLGTMPVSAERRVYMPT